MLARGDVIVDMINAPSCIEFFFGDADNKDDKLKFVEQE
jgi:hypothetical protein